MYYVKNFPGEAPGPPFKGERGRGREGRGASPQIKFYDYSTGNRGKVCCSKEQTGVYMLRQTEILLKIFSVIK
jgi:hypothetical protein